MSIPKLVNGGLIVHIYTPTKLNTGYKKFQVATTNPFPKIFDSFNDSQPHISAENDLIDATFDNHIIRLPGHLEPYFIDISDKYLVVCIEVASLNFSLTAPQFLKNRRLNVTSHPTNKALIRTHAFDSLNNNNRISEYISWNPKGTS